MPYAIMRFQKSQAGGIAGRDRHNERKKDQYKSNPDIDKGKSYQNYHLIQPTKKYKEECMERIEEAGCKVRSNSVVMVETLITASPEFMEKLNYRQQQEYFEHAAEFLYNRVGKQNVISAVVHMDEKNPHMHLSFVPITKDGRLSAKQILGNRAEMSKWQDAFHSYMSLFYPDLQRGIPKAITGRKHIPSYMFKYAAELSNSYPILEQLEKANLFNIKSVKKDVMHDMGHLMKICSSLAGNTKETEAYIKELEKAIQNQKGVIAKQEERIDEIAFKNTDLYAELVATRQQMKELLDQQRKAQQILDRIPEDLKREISKELHKKQRGPER